MKPIFIAVNIMHPAPTQLMAALGLPIDDALDWGRMTNVRTPVYPEHIGRMMVSGLSFEMLGVTMDKSRYGHPSNILAPMRTVA